MRLQSRIAWKLPWKRISTVRWWWWRLFSGSLSRVVRVLNIATVPIISLSRAEHISAELLGIGPDIVWKIPHTLPFGWQKKFVTSSSLITMISCEMSPHLPQKRSQFGARLAKRSFNQIRSRELYRRGQSIRKSMRKRANLIEQAKGEVGAITHRI